MRDCSLRQFAVPALSALIVGVLSAQGAWAADNTHEKSAPASAVASASSAASGVMNTGKLAHADASFLKDAAEANFTEIEGAKEALAKSTNSQVKSYAQQLIDDHTKAGSEVSALAASKEVKLPTEPSLAQRAKLKILKMRDGISFDKHFAKTIGVNAHEDTIKMFEKEVKNGKDADVKALASKLLPTLQHHLEMARDLQAAVDKEKDQQKQQKDANK